MQEQVAEILRVLSWIKIPVSKVERELGFSNGLLTKGSLSKEKFIKLLSYFEKHAIGVPDNMFKYKIYGLVNPENETIFYIGCSRQELEKRLSGHISECNHSWTREHPSKKHAIIIALMKVGKEPKISLLEEIENISLVELFKEAAEREADWIIKLKPIANDTRKLPKNKTEKEINKNNERNRMRFIPRKPKTLLELKERCPEELSGLDRSQWIANERQKYGI